MGHKNPDQFFNDPEAKDPATGQLLHPAPPPQVDPKVQIEQLKAQNAQALAAHKAQLDQQAAQLDAAHQQSKAATEGQLANFKAELDAKLKLLDAHIELAGAAQTARHRQEAHGADIAGSLLDMHHTGEKHRANIGEQVLGMIASAHGHDAANAGRQIPPGGNRDAP